MSKLFKIFVLIVIISFVLSLSIGSIFGQETFRPEPEISPQANIEVTPSPAENLPDETQEISPLPTPTPNPTEEEINEIIKDETVTEEDLGVETPGRFYFFKKVFRVIQKTITFNPIKKSEIELKEASEELLRARKLMEEKIEQIEDGEAKAKAQEKLEKAVEKYGKKVEKIKARVEKIKEKAKDNPKIDKFLDRFTDRTIKHQRLMDYLEKQLSDKPEVLERIRNAKEKALEHFGKVIERLEEKDKIPERLERNLEKIEGSKYKNFKNLEVLLELENKVPEQAREAIRQTQENALKKLHENLEQMSPENQEKFKDYLDKISGDQTTHLRILEKLSEKKLPDALEEKVEQSKERIQERVANLKENLLQLCPEKDSSATIEELKKCIKEEEQESAEEIPQEVAPIEKPKRVVCPMTWAPVCGENGKTYGNSCLAKTVGVEIIYKGKCGEKECEKDADCPQPRCGPTGTRCIGFKAECIEGKCVTVEEPKPETCKDLCGDGVCQEVVCEAVGCPCAETSKTCPQDCKPETEIKCTKEGESMPVYPGHKCCEGLKPISCIKPANGICPSRPCAGAVYCARCGNGICGPGENMCNCPRDCKSNIREKIQPVEPPAKNE